MKRLPILLFLFVVFIPVVLTTGLFGARDKTEVIGKVSWFTEQNTFAEILQIAKKENKPILAVFSATWCSPCQDVKKRVFGSDDFQKVADQVVCLYIEQTDPKAKEHLVANNISAYPTFKIFSPEGIELDGKDPRRTIDGFMEWITEVKAGNNYYELSRKLEKEPNNREVILKLADKIAFPKFAEQIELLRRGIRLNPDYNDPLTQEAYEKLLPALGYMMMGTGDKEDQEKYARENNAEFTAILNAYYPGKFKFQLKGDSIYWHVFRWFNGMGDHDKVLAYFADFLKNRGGKIEKAEDANSFPVIFSSLLRANREKEAEEWLGKLQALLKKEMETAAGPEAERDKEHYAYLLGSFYREFVEYYGEKGEIKKAEAYVPLFVDRYTGLKMTQYAEYSKMRWAKEYLLFADDLVKELDTQCKTAEGKERAGLIQDLAAIYARMGKTAQAKKYLYDQYEDQAAVESLDEKKKAAYYESIASTMIDAKIVEPKTLEVAEKALTLHENPQTIDTLASTYAELGNFAKAIEVEEKALNLTDLDPHYREIFSRKVKKWKTKTSPQTPAKK